MSSSIFPISHPAGQSQRVRDRAAFATSSMVIWRHIQPTAGNRPCPAVINSPVDQARYAGSTSWTEAGRSRSSAGALLPPFPGDGRNRTAHALLRHRPARHQSIPRLLDLALRRFVPILGEETYYQGAPFGRPNLSGTREVTAHTLSPVIGVDTGGLNPGFRGRKHGDSGHADGFVGFGDGNQNLTVGVLQPRVEDIGHVIAPRESVGGKGSDGRFVFRSGGSDRHAESLGPLGNRNRETPYLETITSGLLHSLGDLDAEQIK